MLFTHLSRQTVTWNQITLTAVQYGSVSDYLLYSACGLVDLKVFLELIFYSIYGVLIYNRK